jgi:hypothetical protein
MTIGDMPKCERHLTPLAFAQHLVDAVRRRTGCTRVAVLYCDMRGPYIGMRDVECWPVLAEHYSGPHPIIAHPPCGHWGRFRWKAVQPGKHLGPIAIDQVHLYGGVIEHPWRSRLFIEHARPGAEIRTVDQSDYGHRCRKRTDLYWVLK